MSAEQPQVLIRDDGALDDVRAVLDELRVEYADADKDDPDILPTHMLITSGQYSVQALKQIRSERPDRHIFHLIIIEQRASRTLCAFLKRHGCDMVARLPVHPTVIRLLVQRALYPGLEKRNSRRVAIGSVVKLKAGLMSKTATLAELSLKGCGLVTKQPLKVGTRVTVALPKELSNKGALALAGEVVGAKHGLTVEAGQHAAAIVFEPFGRQIGKQLSDIMRENVVGHTGRVESPLAPTQNASENSPAGLEPQSISSVPASSTASADASATSDVDTDGDRREGRRGKYEESVAAKTTGETHSLIGRDLSVGGMRVTRDESLRVGSILQLAIFGEGAVRPVVVRAEVVRDGGQEGLGLRFRDLPDKQRARLQRIVKSLDEIAETSPASGTVVSEVLERD